MCNDSVVARFGDTFTTHSLLSFRAIFRLLSKAHSRPFSVIVRVRMLWDGRNPSSAFAAKVLSGTVNFVSVSKPVSSICLARVHSKTSVDLFERSAI